MAKKQETPEERKKHLEKIAVTRDTMRKALELMHGTGIPMTGIQRELEKHSLTMLAKLDAKEEELREEQRRELEAQNKEVKG
jgi:hypothetical protein